MYSIRYLLVNELMPDDYYERGESRTPFKELSKERYKEFSPHLVCPGSANHTGCIIFTLVMILADSQSEIHKQMKYAVLWSRFRM